MAKCFVCGKEIEDNGDELQFCSGETCICEYWRRLHRKYRTKKGPITTTANSKIITGNDLMELRGAMSVGDFAKKLHTRSHVINEAERMGDGAIPYPLMKKVCAYLDIEG